MPTQSPINTSPKRALSYRSDIDGLRAIAVLSVVIYHAVSTLLPGGFVGVDVFFVISGYLITGILVGDAQSGNFSLAKFYERRIRRIVPALIAVVLATLFAGYFLLQPGDFRNLGDSAAWTIGFVANVFFWLHTGYFDPARETMPLLHMWSLAVEEQFYLVWPLLVYVLVHLLVKYKYLVWFAMATLFVSSLIASVILTETDPQAAFFLPMTRAWELGAGAILALVSWESIRTKWVVLFAKIAPWLGIGLIVYATTQLNSEMPFPGYNAIYPVLGSALIIFAGGVTTSLAGRFLSIPPMIFVGKISYSLYLWHWPVFVYFRHYTNGQEIALSEAGILIAFSIIFATLSWKYVEQPLRYAKASRTWVFANGAGASVLVIAIAGLIVVNAGFPSRIPEQAFRLADHQTMWSWACPAKHRFDHVSRRRCVLGEDWENAERHAVLWGDSHALHYAPLIDRVARRQGYSVFLFDSCPPYLDNKKIMRDKANQPNYSEECGSEYREIMDFFGSDKKVDLVILAAAWATYPKRIHGPDGERSEAIGLELMDQGISRLAEKFANQKRRVVLMTEVPRSGRNLVPCVQSAVSGMLRRPCDVDPSRLSIADVNKVHAATNSTLRDLSHRFANLSIVDTTTRMCGEDGCDTFVNGEFLYRDNNHLRRNLEPETMDQLIDIIGIEAIMRSLTGQPNVVAQ